jgi:hypothetical protein
MSPIVGTEKAETEIMVQIYTLVRISAVPNKNSFNRPKKILPNTKQYFCQSQIAINTIKFNMPLSLFFIYYCVLARKIQGIIQKHDAFHLFNCKKLKTFRAHTRTHTHFVFNNATWRRYVKKAYIFSVENAKYLFSPTSTWFEFPPRLDRF